MTDDKRMCWKPHLAKDEHLEGLDDIRAVDKWGHSRQIGLEFELAPKHTDEGFSCGPSCKWYNFVLVERNVLLARIKELEESKPKHTDEKYDKLIEFNHIAHKLKDERIKELEAELAEWENEPFDPIIEFERALGYVGEPDNKLTQDAIELRERLSELVINDDIRKLKSRIKELEDDPAPTDDWPRFMLWLTEFAGKHYPEQAKAIYEQVVK